MIRLRVVEGQNKGQSCLLESGQDVLVGREPGLCLMCLDDPGVSRVHARLSVGPAGDITIFDEGSKNGVLVEGHLINGSIRLIPGRLFQIGASLILVESSSGSITGSLMPVGAQQSNPPTYMLEGAGCYNPQSPVSQVMDVTGLNMSIGRDPSNDMVLEHPMVSRFHARLSFQNNRAVLFDLNSVNGTFVNGQQVAGQAYIKPNSLIQICGYRFVFDGARLIEYADNAGQVRIEVQNLGKVIGGGAGAADYIVGGSHTAIKS